MNFWYNLMLTFTFALITSDHSYVLCCKPWHMPLLCVLSFCTITYVWRHLRPSDIQDHRSGIYHMAPGQLQFAVVRCAGEPAEEGAVCAECCCSSAHQHTASRPHHSGFASTPLAAGTETSGVHDCMSGTPVAHVNSTNVPICRHSTRLWARSSSSPLILL